MRNPRLYWIILCASLAAGAQPTPDRIDVIAHIPLAGGPVTRLAAAPLAERLPVC